MAANFNLDLFPEFRALRELVEQQARQLARLEARQIQWVTDEQAQQITGLSRRTLLRERQRPDSLILCKEDHGVRYDYDSLLRHNDSRALGRGRLRALLAPGLSPTPSA